ncbi:MAG: hypothetical protein GY858_07160 [Candidatus Omnitrophica bacterium]|nr:hypothetical protein [Candidatus Omnitrophota bacterium]
MKKLLILLSICIVFACVGCHSVRQKFVRKSKYKKEIPVYVDFKEYPKAPPRAVYNDYCLFVRGWLQDLSRALGDGKSRKRQRRAVNEVIMNLEQIIEFYNDEGKAKISPLREELLVIRDDIEKYPILNDLKRNFLITKVERIRHKFETRFKYSDAKEWLK